MEKVITINLNNNAYALEESGFDRLRAYLESARVRLASNPDQSEIMADLEQAIGDRCRAVLRPHKTVVTAAEIDAIVAEMGPVDDGEAGNAPPAGAEGATAAGSEADTPPPAAAPKRLYRLWDQKLMSGVCTGIGAYFGVDVVWVRIAFVLLTLFTSGIWILFYLALAIIVPRANTAAEVAAAHGAPFSARDLVDRVKKKHEGGRVAPLPTASAVNPAWRQPGYAVRVLAGVLLPIATALSAAAFAAWLVAVALAAAGQMPPGVHLEVPQGVPPAWLVSVLVCVAYAVVAWPLRLAQRAALHQINGGHWFGWANVLAGLLWVLVAGGLLAAAGATCPPLHELLEQLARVDGPLSA